MKGVLGFFFKVIKWFLIIVILLIFVNGAITVYIKRSIQANVNKEQAK